MRNSQHLLLGLAVLSVLSDPWQVFDSLAERPDGKHVRNRIRALVSWAKLGVRRARSALGVAEQIMNNVPVNCEEGSYGMAV
jgi:hypothetical protein